MADLPETSNYDAGVYQIETTDAVIGGVDGKANASARNLANRTKWLKTQVDALLLAGSGYLTAASLTGYWNSANDGAGSGLDADLLDGQHAAAFAAETTTTIGALINSATAKATPVDADMLGLMDSAASNVIKKLSWANLKSALKTYFDGFYASLSTTETSIKTIAASVALNALTISTIAAQTVNFRSATLSDGTINSRSVAVQSLVVPSGATLGTIAATQSRLAVLAIDNAGTPELAVTNIAAGANLDETTLISTKAIATTATGTGVIAVTTGILTISGSPTGTWEVDMLVQGTGVPAGTYITALGTGTGGSGTYYTNITTAVASTAMTGVAGIGIYSTTARSSLPFRVLGYVESTQATAGTWATTPSTVQGQGGQALRALSSLGYGQTRHFAESGASSGTSHTFTGIPVGVKRITVMFNVVSTNGSSSHLIQLGTSGGIQSTGYNSGAVRLYNSLTIASVQFTTGFGDASDDPTALHSGVIIISNMSSNVWAASGNIGQNGVKFYMLAGSVTLGGTLDRVRITTVNGTDTFDAGSINISWEF